MQKSVFLAIVIAISTITLCRAQNSDVNRIIVGAKVLVPNLAGLKAEYILPVHNDRIGIALDYSYLPGSVISSSAAGVNFTYFSFGGNYYLKKDAGFGPYLGLMYQNLGGEFDGTGLDFSALGAVFGFRSKGKFFFGAEFGASRPISSIGLASLRSAIDIEVLPILNLSFGFAFSHK